MLRVQPIIRDNSDYPFFFPRNDSADTRPNRAKDTMQIQACCDRLPAEQTNAQEALDSQRLFPLLLDSVTDYAIFALDARGCIATWNRGAERLKGYRADEILGKHFSSFYPPEDVADRKPDRELEIAQRDGRYEEEGWRLRKDGFRFWANVVITPIRDASGQLQGYAKVTRDVTERMQAKEALQSAYDRLEKQMVERTAELDSSEQLLRLILDTAPANIVYVDGLHRYRFSNRRYTERYGLLPADIMGKHIKTVLGADAYERIRPPLELALAGQPQSFETEISYPGIGNRYVHVDFAPDTKPDGAVQGVVVMV